MSDSDMPQKMSDADDAVKSVGEAAANGKISGANGPTEEELQLMARRRRLLKGLAATVPAIVTLQSGAALANTSGGSTACIAANPNAQTVTAEGSTAGNRCSDGAASPAGVEEWVYVTEDDLTGGGGADSIDGGGGVAAGDSYCLLYVDSAGNRATVNDGGGAGFWGGNGSATDVAYSGAGTKFYAVTLSCYTSFY